MTDTFTNAQAAVDYIRAAGAPRPVIGITLGSGLGHFATQVEDAIRIPYAEIPHFPATTVEGHSGHLVLGTINEIPVAVMQGRVHAYEGYHVGEITFPTRVLGLLGCKTLVVTNAAGGINTGFRQGSLVAISDHINFTGMNALYGPNEPRFAMTHGAVADLLVVARAHAEARSPRHETLLACMSLALADDACAELRVGVSALLEARNQHGLARSLRRDPIEEEADALRVPDFARKDRFPGGVTAPV